MNNSQNHNSSQLQLLTNPHQRGQINHSAFEIDDYKNIYFRTNEQAHTSRNLDSSSQQDRLLINRPQDSNMENLISEQQICIDGSIKNTRNYKKKMSKSSNEQNETKTKAKGKYNKLQRQPSAGQVDYQNRQKFLQKF